MKLLILVALLLTSIIFGGAPASADILPPLPTPSVKGLPLPPLPTPTVKLPVKTKDPLGSIPSTVGPSVSVPSNVIPTPEATPLNKTETASAVFDASTDTLKPVDDTHPRGKVIFVQHELNGPITARISVWGLDAGKQYMTVPYIDGECLPAPGVTAFPSGTFTTNAEGQARTTVTVKPNSLNPAGQFNIRQTNSISIRRLLTNAAGRNIPTPITEACNENPNVNSVREEKLPNLQGDPTTELPSVPSSGPANMRQPVMLFAFRFLSILNTIFGKGP